ncbi:MAG: hypothetical protein HFF57_01385 [Lawsonibacter sp.]|jgi:hypothetical protein|nr:hypothetical protein [Lawsonibacter sp.]
MNCPICGKEMVTGEAVMKPGAGPTLYPRKTEDSELKYMAKLFFGSKDSIKPGELDGCWYCAGCKKLIAVWNERASEKNGTL